MKLIVVSTNAAMTMGGEAVKALQYVQVLLAQGRDVTLITHERCRAALKGALPADRVLYVRDTRLMQLCWRVPGLSRLVNTLFHHAVRHLCRQFDPADVVIHYLCPISPVEQRLPPHGYRYIIGPVSGNIFYPPGFRHLESRGGRLQEAIYRPLQQALGIVSRQYVNAEQVLVSGYDRTSEALRWAGCPPEKMRFVRDAGLEEALFAHPRARPEAAIAEFVWIGRMVPYKGADLAIRALAATPPDIGLTLYGDGPDRAELEVLTAALGLEGRVRFAGWLAHDSLGQVLGQYRGLIFSTLKEANGIIMQESMAIGLPVLTLRWGGPQGLAGEGEARFVDPETPEQVIRDLALEMTRLARDGDLVAALSQAARQKAEQEFPWHRVAADWYDAADRGAVEVQSQTSHRSGDEG
ncbi:glycosyltransferase family 4 protein [Tritonibacter horizontis]|uniref:Mannosylfructose-phosphate synthase n=1 Tax=Tritonibacter horizontis TaxID=1768241 RepID=A0A132BYG0_9RHOB|nr:glycosyltransferase family 4 protein [Tritonibacter horizontis]KUP93415.1 mannosylfructose-phosphate synthase [Tritonibacter horizontis]